jgi:dihydrofolate reductase
VQTVSLWMQMSLDGYASGPDGAFDWPVVTPELQRMFVDELGRAGAFLYGRKVYEGMAAFWPTADEVPGMSAETAEYARIWRPMPKVVFSTTLQHADWNTRIAGEVNATVDELKRQPGNGLVLFGGPDIAATFIEQGLVDEYRLFVHPVTLGGGTSLFPASGVRHKLDLVEARTFAGGVTHVHYRPAASA